VCLGETFARLIGETRGPWPASPGQVERYDHVHVRNGTASLFLAFEPLAGWRHVAVTDGRRRADWALFVRELAEGRYRDAAEVALVTDQLDTHSPAGLYETFPPEEARRLTDRPEIHRTPKRGSWLTMAEIEFSALAPRPAGAGQRQADAGAPRGGLGAAAERRRGRGRLALHHRRRPHQAPQALPDDQSLTRH
jgi:hypothetical protein